MFNLSNLFSSNVYNFVCPPPSPSTAGIYKHRLLVSRYVANEYLLLVGVQDVSFYATSPPRGSATTVAPTPAGLTSQSVSSDTICLSVSYVSFHLFATMKVTRTIWCSQTLLGSTGNVLTIKV